MSSLDRVGSSVLVALLLAGAVHAAEEDPKVADEPEGTRAVASDVEPADAAADAPSEGAAPKEGSLEALPDDEESKRLLDKNDPRAKAGVVVGARGIDPGWKDSRVAERSPNLFGQTGVLRVNSARAGKGGYFDIGLHGRYFTFPNFIAELPDPDLDVFVGGTITFGVTILDYIELSVASQVATNSNTGTLPNVQITTGDFLPSLKLSFPLLPVAFGVDVRGYFPTARDKVGIDLNNFGIIGTGLFTVDLYETYDIPLKFHLNGGYAYANASRAPDVVRYRYDTVVGHLLGYASQAWFYDQVFAGVAAEMPFPYATPFVELWVQSSIGVPGDAGPSAGGYDFVRDSTIIASPGVRFSAGRGLHFDLGVDIGLGGTGGFLEPTVSNLTPGQPINPAWALQLAVTYTFSPFVAETQVEVRQAGVPTGTVDGCVVDDVTGAAIEDAFVEFAGTAGPRIVVDEKGCFKSPLVPIGDLDINVKQPDYKPASVQVKIMQDDAVSTEVRMTPAPRFGRFKGVVTNEKDEVVEATIEVEDEGKKKKAAQTEGGNFDIQLVPGKYQAVAKAKGYLVQGKAVTIEPLGKTIVNFVLKREGARVTKLTSEKIEISSRIPFEFNKARLLKAAEFILDDVVDVILQNPQLTLIRVEGHTDNVGESSYNKELSEARASAVAEYLVAHGVAQARLEANGYGFSRPIAPNDSEEGRAKNRRVDFVIVEQGDTDAPAPEPAAAPAAAASEDEGAKPKKSKGK